MSDGIPVPKAASLEDHKAAETLQQNDQTQLETMRARSAEWVKGLTALSGLFGVVLVVKGPETTEAIATCWAIVVAVLLLLAFGLLGYATYQAYSAAYGSPGKLTGIDPNPLAGLADRLQGAREAEVRECSASIRAAVELTFFAMLLIIVAVGITWFAPRAAADRPAGACGIGDDGNLLVSVVGGSVIVSSAEVADEVERC